MVAPCPAGRLAEGPPGGYFSTRLLAAMASQDEVIRANAVRQICPCRLPDEVFFRLRRAAKRLQKDPSPLVRANALHVEENARMVASFEAQAERISDREESAAFARTSATSPRGPVRAGRSLARSERGI